MEQHFELNNVNVEDIGAAISGVAARLRALIVAEIGDRPGVYDDLLDPETLPPDPSLDALSNIVHNIEEGKDIRDQFDKISRLIHNQDSRAEVIGSLSQTHDYHRYVNFLKARQRIEHILLTIANRGNLTPGDALALLEYITENVKTIEAKTARNSVSGKDIAALIGKIDYLVDTQQQAMQKQLANTTPQNREIMRRVATKLLKAAKAAPAS